jgi:hypothetical protein
LNIYRTAVSGVFRRNDFWFRGLWRKPGHHFAVRGRNPAGQFLQEEHDAEFNECAPVRRRRREFITLLGSCINGSNRGETGPCTDGWRLKRMTPSADASVEPRPIRSLRRPAKSRERIVWLSRTRLSLCRRLQRGQGRAP